MLLFQVAQLKTLVEDRDNKLKLLREEKEQVLLLVF
jgi:hypothetical protein